MGYVLNIVRTGVLPAITGGWYYDPDLNRFTNVFHIYLWLLYVLLPLVLFVVSLYKTFSVLSQPAVLCLKLNDYVINTGYSVSCMIQHPLI